MEPTDMTEIPTSERYKFGNQISHSGESSIYAAKDEKIGRDVAIKSSGEIENLDAVKAKQYVEEARLLAKAEHPHVIRVYDVFTREKPNGKLEVCYSIPLKNPEDTLEERRKKGPLPPKALEVLITQTAQTIDDLADENVGKHQFPNESANVRFRDLKSSNIILEDLGTEDKPDWQVTMLDPGISNKMLEKFPELSDKFTPEIAPREMFFNDCVEDTRTEQAMLAATVYEVVTGEPFREIPDVENLDEQYIVDTTNGLTEQQIYNLVEALSEQGYYDEFQEKLIKSVHKATSANKEDRFATTVDFANAIYGE